MDTEKLKNTIAEYYTKLPQNLQQFFSGMSWVRALQEINTKFGLSQEQIEILYTETTLVLLCIQSFDQYLANISKINISEEKFNDLLSEINNNIFKDIGFEIEEAFIKNASSFAQEKYGNENKKIDEHFSNLPKEVQIAINESNYQSSLYKIADKHKLNIEQMGIFEEITTQIMLGIINPISYQEELLSKLQISKEQAEDIVKDVNNDVLVNIREALKKHWDDNNSPKEDIVPLPPYQSVKPEPIKPEHIPNIVEQKLERPITSDHVVSDYSTPKKDIKPSTDPYREVI